MRIYDPVAGGAALVVIDVGSHVGDALAVFKDPATGEPRLACGCGKKGVFIFDPVAGGEALLVIDVGGLDNVNALVGLRGPGDGRAAARLWLHRERKVRASSTRSRAARRCSCSTWATM